MKKYRIFLDEKYCKGCEICINFCPKNVYKISNRISKDGYLMVDILFPKKCIGCRTCELMCPDQVIIITEAENEI